MAGGVELATAYVNLTVSAKDVAPQTAKAFGGVERQADVTGKKAGKRMGAGVTSGLGGVAKGVAGMFAGVLAGMGVASFLSDSIAEARESQKVGALTANVIKATGGAAKITADQVGDLATAISNKTGIDDEAIQTGSNLLLTFKNVRNEAGKGSDVFNRATQAAVDLSAAGFGSVDGAAKMLGKALNDPLKGISALGRAGVTFTAGQKKQIEGMVKAGDVLGAQKIIMKEVESQVGGAAAASATAGEKAAVAFGNLKESLGTALLPIVDKVATFLSEKAIPAIRDFASWLGPKLAPAVETLKGLLNGLVTNVQAFIADFAKGEGVAGQFRSALEGAGAVIQNVTKWVSENQTVVKSLVVALAGGLVAFKAITTAVKIYTGVQAILNAVMAANPIGIVIVAIGALVAGLIYAYKTSETFRSYVSTAFSVIKLGALTMARIAITAIGGIVSVFLGMVGAVISGAAAAFGWVPGLGPKLKTAAAKFETFKTNTNASLDKIKNDIDLKIRTENANRALEELHREFINKGWTVTATANVNMVYTGNGQVQPRANGGPVRAGSAYIVGERRPELFVPSSNGTIIPRVPKSSAGLGGLSAAQAYEAIYRGARDAIEGRNRGLSLSIQAAGR